MKQILLSILFISLVACSNATKDTVQQKESIQKEARDNLSEEIVSIQQEEINLVLDNILFNFNKASLREESYSTLQKIANLMQKHPEVTADIKGHSDNIGSMKAKEKIASGRAKTVANYLIRQGIQRSRVTYKGVSDKEPRVPNDTRSNRSKNRRVDVKLNY